MVSDFVNDLYGGVVFAGIIYNEILINDIKALGIYLYIHTGIAFWNSWL